MIFLTLKNASDIRPGDVILMFDHRSCDFMEVEYLHDEIMPGARIQSKMIFSDDALILASAYDLYLEEGSSFLCIAA